MAKRRIGHNEVAVGTELAWDVFDSENRLLLRRGHVIVTSNQIDALIERGLFAETDPIHERAEPERPLVAEHKSAVALILEARRRLQNVCALQGSGEGFADHVVRVGALLRDACGVNQSAALATVLLDRQGRYSIRHSVDAALTCRVVGASLKLDETQLSVATAAALTMNLSMLWLQDALQERKAPLTTEQQDTIRQHPVESVRMLEALGVTDRGWLDIVRDHHEAIDGSGYPAGKKDEELTLAAKLVALSDIYCARVSGRAYRPPLRPNTALRRIFIGDGAAVDKALAAQFIRALGVFPPGTAVRLENGEIAVVIHHGEKATTPCVSAVIGPRGAPLGAPIRRDTSVAAYAVREAADWSELGGGVNLQALWGKDAALT